MDVLVFIFYIMICIFFIVNSIISIFNIEKNFNTNKAPSFLNFLYDIKAVDKKDINQEDV